MEYFLEIWNAFNGNMSVLVLLFFITHSMFSGSIAFWVKDCRDVEGLIINLCCREPRLGQLLVVLSLGQGEICRL